MAHITINQYLQQVNLRLFPSVSLGMISSMFTLRVVFFFVGAFLFQVYEAIENREGSFCAELLSFKHPHVANPRLQVGLLPPQVLVLHW